MQQTVKVKLLYHQRLTNTRKIAADNNFEISSLGKMLMLHIHTDLSWWWTAFKVFVYSRVLRPDSASNVAIATVLISFLIH